MSRNFELMQQASADHEPLRVDNTPRQRAEGNFDGNGRHDGTSFDLNRVAREELLKLVQRVFLRQAPTRPQAVVFAGVDPGDGSTRICANAAKLLALNSSGLTCLVDANRCSTSLPRILGTTNRLGLTDALSRKTPIRDFIQPLSPANLRFLCCGSSDANMFNVWNCDGLKARIEELRREFEFLVFNVPSVLLDGTATLLGSLVDGVILVVEANSTHREVARKAKERLQSANARLLGAVFNNRTFPIPAALYSKL